MHSISEDERDAFAGHINLILGSDVFLQDRLPMDPTDPNALFEVCKDGILLAKLVNKVEPGTVDERALNLKVRGLSQLTADTKYAPAEINQISLYWSSNPLLAFMFSVFLLFSFLAGEIVKVSTN